MQLFKIGPAAREASVSVDTMRSYADRGWIACQRLEDGTRIFTRAAIKKAREIRDANLARLRQKVDP